MDKRTYVYIMASNRNGTLYIGATTNLIQRIYQHKNKFVKGFVSKYNVIKLVYFEVFGDIDAGYYRERQLKHWKREWKIRLIEEMNPYWNDLYDSIMR